MVVKEEFKKIKYLACGMMSFILVLNSQCKSRSGDFQSETSGIGKSNKYFLYGYHEVDSSFSQSVADTFKDKQFCFGEVTTSNTITLAAIPCDGRPLSPDNTVLLYTSSSDTQVGKNFSRPIYLDGITIGLVEESPKDSGHSNFKLKELCTGNYANACSFSNLESGVIQIQLSVAGDPQKNKEMIANRPLPRRASATRQWPISVFSHIPSQDQEAIAWYESKYTSMSDFQNIGTINLGEYTCESRNFNSWATQTNKAVSSVTIGTRDRNTLATNAFGPATLDKGSLYMATSPDQTTTSIRGKDNYLYFKRTIKSGQVAQYGECILKASNPIAASRPLDIDLYPEDLNMVTLSSLQSPNRQLALQSLYDNASPLKNLNSLQEGYYKCQWGFWATYWVSAGDPVASPQIMSISKLSDSELSIKPFGNLVSGTAEPTIKINWGPATHSLTVRQNGNLLYLYRFVTPAEKGPKSDLSGPLAYGECGFLK